MSTAPPLADQNPPITCHVLDTTIGRPAAGIPVRLYLDNPPTPASSHTITTLIFHGTTNADGRVVAWSHPRHQQLSLRDAFNDTNTSDDADGGKQRWALTFDVLPYLAGKKQPEGTPDPFFEEVVVRFVVGREQRVRGEHFHVPLLLGGFGFSVYRGS